MRGTGGRADASLRTGHGMGIPSTNGPKLLYSLLLFPRRSLRWRWRGGGGGWCCYPFISCHCEERSDAAIRSFETVLACEACPGGHIGPPLRRGGGLREVTELVFAAVWRRGGTEPAPYTKTRSPAGGGVRPGCGFRQPNSVPEFGASVMGRRPLRKGTGDADCRVGLGPPRNDSCFLSFRGAKQRT